MKRRLLFIAGRSAAPYALRDNQDGVRTMFRKLIIAATASSLILGLSACNTVKGLGRDIESVGQAGDDAINK
jgi:predicted small secreted protein